MRFFLFIECEIAVAGGSQAYQLLGRAAIDGNLQMACRRHRQQQAAHTHIVVVGAERTQSGRIAARIETGPESAARTDSLEFSIGDIKNGIAIAVDIGDRRIERVGIVRLARGAHQTETFAGIAHGPDVRTLDNTLRHETIELVGKECVRCYISGQHQLDRHFGFGLEGPLQGSQLTANEIMASILQKHGLWAVVFLTGLHVVPDGVATHIDNMDGPLREFHTAVTDNPHKGHQIVPYLFMADIDNLDIGNKRIKLSLHTACIEITLAPIGCQCHYRCFH